MTSDCNFQCTYCYNDAGTNKHMMSLETGERCLDVIANLSGKRTVILLHGGEPLLNMPLIEHLLFLKIKKYNTRNIQFSMQTNASLLDEKLAKFIKKNKISISVSLDGSTLETNTHRRYPNGDSSLRDIVRGMEILKQYKIKFGCISILTQANYLSVEDHFKLLKRYNIDFFAFNPLVKTGRAQNAFNEITLSPDELFQAYKVILKKIASINKKLDPGQYIKERNIYYMVSNLLTRKRRFMCQRGPCGAGTSLISITTDGQIYPCDDFVGVPGFGIGNVFDSTILQSITESSQCRLFSKAKPDKIPQCKECAWCWICNAGCAARRFYDKGTLLSIDPMCDFYNKFFPYLIRMWKNGELKYIYVDH